MVYAEQVIILLPRTDTQMVQNGWENNAAEVSWHSVSLGRRPQVLPSLRSIQTPIETFSRNGRYSFVLTTNTISGYQSSSSSAVQHLRRPFNFCHRKHTWQTASRTKRLRQRWETALRPSSSDPRFAPRPGHPRTAKTRATARSA